MRAYHPPEGFLSLVYISLLVAPRQRQHDEETQNGSIRTRPHHARALDAPENAKRRQHHAHRELHGVFWHPTEWLMHQRPDHHHEHKGAASTQGGQWDAPLGGAEGE